jgi:hypothetical protein
MASKEKASRARLGRLFCVAARPLSLRRRGRSRGLVRRFLNYNLIHIDLADSNIRKAKKEPGRRTALKE